MTGITIQQTAIGQVQHTNKERDEHIGLISLAQRLIQSRSYLTGF